MVGPPVEIVPDYVILAYLRRHIGEGLLAYLAGYPGMWGVDKVPHSDARLRLAYETVEPLVEAFGDKLAQSWLFGSNYALDGMTPAQAIRCSFTPGGTPIPEDRIKSAARSFLGGGYA